MYIAALGLSEGLCQTPVERAELACLPLEHRWSLYRGQRGKKWSYFLEQREYRGFIETFPFSRDAAPEQHKNALLAQKKYRDVQWFAHYHQALSTTAGLASLYLDEECNLVLVPEKRSFLALLGTEVARAVADYIRENATEFILGPRIAKILGVAELVLQLMKIWDCERRRKLVNEQHGKMRDEAFKRKLSLVMDVKAAQLARGKPGTSRVDQKSWLVHQYFRFEPIWLKYEDYLSREETLDPNFREEPSSFRPAR